MFHTLRDFYSLYCDSPVSLNIALNCSCILHFRSWNILHRHSKCSFISVKMQQWICSFSSFEFTCHGNVYKIFSSWVNVKLFGCMQNAFGCPSKCYSHPTEIPFLLPPPLSRLARQWCGTSEY